jgi:hypothetical protein
MLMAKKWQSEYLPRFNSTAIVATITGDAGNFTSLVVPAKDSSNDLYADLPDFETADLPSYTPLRYTFVIPSTAFLDRTFTPPLPLTWQHITLCLCPSPWCTEELKAF